VNKAKKSSDWSNRGHANVWFVQPARHHVIPTVHHAVHRGTALVDGADLELEMGQAFCDWIGWDVAAR
jgi:hypothetical protein